VNKIIFELGPYVDLVRKFITDRSDMFTGDIKIFKNPRDVDYCPERPISLYEAVNLKDVRGGKDYANAMNEFHKELTIELICAVLCEHFNSIPEEFSNAFYLLANSSIHKCQRTDAACWAKICKAARRTSVPYATLRDGLYRTKRVPIGITNSDIRNIFQELFVSVICEMRNILPDNYWLTVDFQVKGDNVHLHFGEDLRHVIFKRDHGEDKWKGDYELPSTSEDK